VLAALADFYDSLKPEQQAKVREFMASAGHAGEPGHLQAGPRGFSPQCQRMRRLLLIDDDERLGPPLAAFFQRHGLQMQHATRPSSRAGAAAGGGFDAAILDVMLPEMDGFESAAVSAAAGPSPHLPIVMLTARGDVMDRVVGLELGADDYLPKPFEPRELLARIQTVLRRGGPAASGRKPGRRPALRRPGHRPGPPQRATPGPGGGADQHRIRVAGAAGQHTGQGLHRDDILARLRGQPGQDIHSRAVDILVSRLRKKLEPLDAIHTLRNAGYLFAGVRV
jgi:two-component system OmpR family response regulator